MHRPPIVVAAICLLGGLSVLVACAPAGSYSRLPDFDADGVGGDDGSGGRAAGLGGAGMGGATGSGGLVGSGGVGGGKGGSSSPVGGAGGHVSTPGGNGGGGKTVGGGGAPGVGGKGGTATSSGGVVGTGGVVGSGGTVGSGGSTATGGTTASGGAGGKGGAAVAGKGGAAPAMGGRGGSASGGAAGGPAPLILSIDFVGGGSGGGAGSETFPMAASEVAGVKKASHWNSASGAMGSLSTLMDSTGNPVTGASATWDVPVGTGNTGIWHIGYADAPGDVRMMNGCLNPGWTGITPPSTPVPIVTVSGLPAFVSTGFDVYVYVLGGVPNETRSYDYTINSLTINVMQVGPTPTTVPSPFYTLAPNGGAGNYIVFKNVTGSAFYLKVQPGTGTTATLRAPVNGMQIVWPTGS